MPGIAHSWGSTPEERGQKLSCDHFLATPDEAYFRAVGVNAPAAVTFSWLCQLKVAPYSYDWIDNYFRKSPRRLTPGMRDLAPGQRVMTIFRLAAFETDRHLTLVLDREPWIRAVGEIAMSYVVTPCSESECRLLVKILIRYPGRGIWRSMRWLLPWGDLFMMRKQLLTLKALSERDAGGAAGPFQR